MRCLFSLLFLFIAIGHANEQEHCGAIVEYTASTGDPSRASSSPIFRGFTKIAFREPLKRHELIAVNWTFAGGEIIQGEKDIFEDVSSEFPEGTISDFDFSSTTKADTQSVELHINSSDDSRVQLGFVGYKGSNVTSSEDVTQDPFYQVALPNDFLVNDYYCEAAPVLLQTEKYVSQPENDKPITESGIRLTYIPLEFKDQRFTTGLFASSSQFAFRLFNRNRDPVNLKDIAVEYWFDGDDIDELYAEASPDLSQYKSSCSLSSRDCSTMRTQVQMGLRNVQGAHYKVVIFFTEKAGILPPNQHSSTDDNGTFLEAVVNINSSSVFSQMDVTEDFSFRNTSLTKETTEHLVQRVYEPNLRMPVYRSGVLVWGSPPKAGRRRINQSEIDEDGGFCYLKSQGIPQCGLKMRYCCQLASEEGSLFNRPPDSSVSDPADLQSEVDGNGDEEAIPAWIFGAAVVGFLLAVFICGLIVVRVSSRSRRDRYTSQTSSRSRSRLYRWSEDQDEFGSSAWSIRDTGAVSKRKLVGYGQQDEVLLQDVKYHTVPSISESESFGLKHFYERQETTSLRSSLPCQTWTGCMHWIWEPWDVASVRRANTTANSTKRLPTFQFATKEIQNIPLNIDYASEIEPHLGQLLGEGGFGQVYAAYWNGQPVAVKLMKVETDVMYKSLKDEVKLTSRICHDRIVRLLAACLTDKNRICLIMELVENGNLSKRIHNRKIRKLEYLQILQVGLDIAQGLDYLHPTIIHRDLKPQNVLLDAEGRAKIADFGISRFKDPHQSYLSVTQTGGTPNYMAPELFNGTRVDEKCDIYSLGCILYEAVTRRVPLSDLPSENCAPLFQIIKTVAIDKRRPKIPEHCPHGFARIIRQCWKDNPRSRPSASELCVALTSLIEKEIHQVERFRRAYFKSNSKLPGQINGRISHSDRGKNCVISSADRREVPLAIELRAASSQSSQSTKNGDRHLPTI